MKNAPPLKKKEKRKKKRSPRRPVLLHLPKHWTPSPSRQNPSIRVLSVSHERKPWPPATKNPHKNPPHLTVSHGGRDSHFPDRLDKDPAPAPFLHY